MGEYDAITAKAKALLAKKGKAYELLVYTNAVPADPSKPWRMPESAPTSYPFSGLIVGFGITSQSAAGETARKCIIPGDVAAHAADIPNLTSLIRDGTELWMIDSLEPVAPDGVAIIYLAKVSQWPPKTLPAPLT